MSARADYREDFILKPRISSETPSELFVSSALLMFGKRRRGRAWSRSNSRRCRNSKIVSSGNEEEGAHGRARIRDVAGIQRSCHTDTAERSSPKRNRSTQSFQLEQTLEVLRGMAKAAYRTAGDRSKSPLPGSKRSVD